MHAHVKCKSRSLDRFNMTKIDFDLIWLIKTNSFFPKFSWRLCILTVFLLASKHLQHLSSQTEAGKSHVPWCYMLLGWRTPVANLILCMFLESGAVMEMPFWRVSTTYLWIALFLLNTNSSVIIVFSSAIWPSTGVARVGEAFPLVGPKKLIK